MVEVGTGGAATTAHILQSVPQAGESSKGFGRV